MADFEHPSFSLGLDFDPDSELHPVSNNNPPSLSSSGQAKPPPTTSVLSATLEDDDDFVSPNSGQLPEPPRTLKRLRRGATCEPASVCKKVKSSEVLCDLDDDIEEFSQEDLPRDEPTRNYSSLCSSSKVPLHGSGIFISQSENQLTGKKKEVLNASTSANTFSSMNRFVFPKLTTSPIRRFQLIDSDSDSEAVTDGLTNSLLKDRNGGHGDCTASGEPTTGKKSVNVSQTEDLWQDFCLEKSFHISTPALDEVCDEYFKSVNDDSKPNSGGSLCQTSKFKISNVQHGDLQLGESGHLSPAHLYFFHDDIRIQKLVRDRLPHFFPLGVENNQECKQNNASTIDYMGQFGSGEGTKQSARASAAGTRSTKSRKNSKNLRNNEFSQESSNWVNPRCSAEIPKDAGKRRVQAVGKSSGHWYTADGRRVYVTKNGQELTGRMAYRHYKKESGAGFGKSKKKSAAENKPAAKKKTTAKKR